ncbi:MULTISPECIES: oligosaccharide flippase family protein [Nocardiaceae]|uniref:O-antigen/teichoic acid export membrane protein n=1 Tax=Rhodococcoides corynebacterioides TaxID=53972 RepID=A0ABS2KZB7_9NOCA|nr:MULTISPECIES: oligosaccharide flippase family protein [Rhodococcus]MBM7417282.1 O-antigen/teichoic acid export membrane protein [Rhodococcus corynebacterioides]MBP1115535.1 O-antigen/teichoic acid export membrane protein [Rhodococcus sp. PvP016]
MVGELTRGGSRGGPTTEPPKHRRGSLHKLSAVRDIAFVSFGKYGQYLVTIVTLPLTARILGTEGLGLLAIAMSAYFIGSLLVDFGITTFLAAMANDENLNQLRGNYLALRATVLAVMGTGLLASLLVGAHVHLHMILLGLFAGGFASFGDDWVLVAQARFGIGVVYQGIGRVLYLVLLVTLLPMFPSAAVAMLCLLASSVVSVALTWRLTIREFGPPSKPKDVTAMVRMGVPVLTSRLLITSYGQGAATFYSVALSAASLGIFSASDRLIRAFQSLLDAIGYGLLPRLARGREDHFWQNALRGLTACVGVAVVATVGLWVSAPLLISLVFGDQFSSAVDIMRVQVFILPFTAITSFVTTAILPVRQDTKGVLIGAVIGTVFAAGALATALSTASVWALVYGTLTCEVAVAAWYLLRVRMLHRRNDDALRAESEAPTVPMAVVASDAPTVPLAVRRFREASR